MLGHLFGSLGGSASNDSIAWTLIADRLPEGFVVGELIREGGRPDGAPVDYRHIYGNAAWADITGLSVAAVAGVPAREAFPDLEESWRDDFIRVVEEQVSLDFERYTAVTNTEYSAQVFPVGGDRFAILLVDITQMKATEDALRDRNRRMDRRLTGTVSEVARTWDVTPDLLAVFHMDGRFDQINPAWTKLLGYDPEVMTGELCMDHIHPDDLGASEGALSTINAGDPVLRFENRYRHVDGSYRWLSWVAVPEGERIYGSARDITRDKQRRAALASAEDALRQSQKMEVIGQLTGGIAHDFNNLLMAIQSSVSLAKRRIEDGRTDSAQEMLDNALKGVSRGAGLTQHMLAFARKQDLSPQSVDAAEMVTGMRGLMERAVGPEIRIDTSFTDHVPPALVDINQLEMALLNLAINAKDAMEGKGVLNICVDTTTEDGTDGVAAGNYVLLRVQDEGCGMDADTLAKATEPFFTTKATGQGTGLGLSMIHGLARQSGGTFRLRSEPGVGTVADILLPVHTAADEKAAPAPEPKSEPKLSSEGDTAPAQRSLHILAVDDDFLVLLGTEGMLEDLGHRVSTAMSGKDALDVLSGPDPVDLVITDQAMPEMTGIALGKIIRGLHPDIPAVLATGYSDIDAADAALFSAVMGKPFSDRELARIIDDILDRTG